jgi:hypothetical protein
MEELVEKYIELRDAKSKIKAAYEAKVGKLDNVLDRIEGALLQQFNDSGMESVRTKAGTAYKQTRATASVADRDAFREFVKQNELWSVADMRVSKAGCEEYRAEHGDLPPGVNWREEVVINVRRS